MPDLDVLLLVYLWIFILQEEGIYELKQESKKAKHAFDQVRFKKNEGSKWKTQIGIKHFVDIFNLVESTNDRNFYEVVESKID